MADADRGGQAGEAFFGEPVAGGVLPCRGKEAPGHPLALDAQHHDDVGLGEHRIQVGADLATPGVDAHRQQRRRGHQRDLAAQGALQQHVRAHHTAVQQVADDGDALAGEGAVFAEGAEVLAHGEGVQEGLRRMLVLPVAGVDALRLHPTGRLCDRAGR